MQLMTAMLLIWLGLHFFPRAVRTKSFAFC